MNASYLRLIPALAAVAAVVPSALAVGGGSPAGPALLPDLEQETPSQLVVTRGGHSWRLGFRSAVRNVGAGPLIITGHRLGHAQKTMDADQEIVHTDGLERVRRTGRLRYVRSPDHQHWHLLRFDEYELRRPGAGAPVVRDRKTGFCLGDRYAVTTRALAARPPEPVYTRNCGLERPGLLGVREGISVGYGDNYNANLEGQYLPLDRVRRGRYLLVHRVNADHRLRESSYDNNASSVLLRVRWRRGVPRLTILAVCPGSDRCPAPR